ncbi:exopolysaccharide biosynthesis polyprenyl glycosylphosphotransferase [Brachybacterium aquaticum]|uniref:Exopolysaccharide biosynthesis polyprenyl glycosylphosphotransferase n=1 Tax=Brachybacterium aquaticum TaxID=1432564 RepID=A0A841AHH8_9MICO|nr:exopolysaccharide biosynthesis polyprenyl glycosylphosphotransferase [Brachybacterium aquaticum]
MPLMVTVDLLALVIAGAIAFVVRQEVLGPAGDLSENVADASSAMTAGWLLAIAFLNGYDRRLLPSGPELFRNVLHASVAAFGIVGAVVYLLDLELSRAYFLAFFALGPPLLVIDRLVLRRALNALRVRGHLRSSVIAVGPVEHVDDLARTIHRERWLGMDIVGAVIPASSRAVVGEQSTRGIPVLGTEADLLAIAAERSPEVLLFTAGSTANAEEFRRTAWALEDRDIRVIVVPALTEISAERVSMRPVAGLPLVHMDLPRARRAVTWAKRAFDVVGSALALVLLSPVLGLIALSVKLNDGGPVIFRQERVGHDGKLFEFLKFRTMVTDAEAIQVEMTERWAQDKGNDVMFKMRNDPRITKPGRFLRRYSLDELPQLWNVVRGEMSLVGPRPALPREVAVYTEDAHRRHNVRPGITGLWQVSGRSDLSWEDTMRLDLYYVDNWSFTQDLLILIRTVRAVISSAGAY